MLIFKQPRIGGEVGWHQDASFLITEPDSVTGFWFALEDATLDNGCLWVQPGGHRGPLARTFPARRRRRRGSSGWTTRPGRPSARRCRWRWPPARWSCLHGLLPHYSAPNRSAQSRLAYTLHVVDAASHWSAQNWLRPAAASAARGLG